MNRPILLPLCLVAAACAAGCQTTGGRTAMIDRPRQAGFWTGDGQPTVPTIRTASAEGASALHLARRGVAEQPPVPPSAGDRIPLPRTDFAPAAGRLADLDHRRQADGPIGAF